jgi:hypothetical protein
VCSRWRRRRRRRSSTWSRCIGGLAYHTFDSRRSAGGYPDLTLVRERVIFAEVKRPGERPRADQVAWLGGLARTGAEVYLWTLDDLDEIGLILACRGGVDFVPGSAWIPGRGRSDAA